VTLRQTVVPNPDQVAFFLLTCSAYLSLFSKMHFYYLDEAGCTGADLHNAEQPVFVLGGISVRDEGWKITQSDFSEILTVYFGGTVPDSFELHAEELLSPTGDVPFTGHDRDRRNSLAKQVLQLLHHRSHDVHLFAIDKAKLSAHPPIEGLSFEPHVPFLLAYDYLITFIDWFVRECLGRSARGMIILDAKPEFLAGVHTVTHARRDDFVWHNEQHRRGKRNLLLSSLGICLMEWCHGERG